MQRDRQASPRRRGLNVYDLVPQIARDVEAGRLEEARRTFGEVTQALALSLTRLACGKIGDWQRAEEIASDVLMGLWHGILKHRTQLVNPRGYVNTVMSYVVADYLEAKSASREVPQAYPPGTDSAGEGRSSPEDPAVTAERQEKRKMVRAAIEALDEPDRSIAQRALQGKSLRKIADELGLGFGKVRYRLEKFAAVLEGVPGSDA